MKKVWRDCTIHTAGSHAASTKGNEMKAQLDGTQGNGYQPLPSYRWLTYRVIHPRKIHE